MVSKGKKSGVRLNSNLDRRDIYELVLTQLKEFERPDTEDNGMKPFLKDHWGFNLHLSNSIQYFSNFTFSLIKPFYPEDHRNCNCLLSPDNTAESALMEKNSSNYKPSIAHIFYC